jgi:hypothetical protein
MGFLCKYKNIFGEEQKGIHSIRLFNIAIVDLIMTVIVAYIVSNKYKLSFWKVMIYLMIAGIILHRIFCVNTTINKTLFGIAL